MIKQGIISVPTTESSAQNDNATIPDWVRNMLHGGLMVKLMITHLHLEFNS